MRSMARHGARALISLLVASLFQSTCSWSPALSSLQRTTTAAGTNLEMYLDSSNASPSPDCFSSRRALLLKTASAAASLVATTLGVAPPDALAATSTANAQVTDRIFVEVKGLGGPSAPTQRIVIGLFGKDAPRSTRMLKQLVNSKEGLAAPCKPKAERTLQKEQLEANKVYSTCIEQQDQGVNYEYSQIWRVIRNQRIDVGAVSGKFISREFPTWQEDQDSGLKHDAPGVVSVRRGNDSGFGFTIYPGGGSSSSEAAAAAQLLDRDHIVVGRVENLDIVTALNEVPVITSSKIGGAAATEQVAPNRSCTYGGGQLYCNEYKPLNKLSTLNAGVL